ncbi:hypothetical protein SAMN05421676_10887 [Salinibacillus kushneri]|uniref:Sporulation membrane protein YtrI C-terminal domain-containing protein n=1 Tax=Salinibacillus kushneri TaxID=237682 RepID=A0A1I0H9K6_9BACI|nr:sporulation membrane protein YtrI [Salinibacillus kushneri]SET79524.1 hypothetical protein SAMN05421676_10887 [Salinibacillus kushneri]
MHIPPYYKRRGFQYFFVGIITGAVIAYLLFLYFFGKYTEMRIEENIQLRDQIAELEQDLENITKDKEDLSRQNEENLTIQEIQIELENAEQLKLDRFIQHDLKEKIKDEISSLKGRNIETMQENLSFIESTIENKTYHVSDFSYDAAITRLIISKTFYVKVKLSMSSS